MAEHDPHSEVRLHEEHDVLAGPRDPEEASRALGQVQQMLLRYNVVDELERKRASPRGLRGSPAQP